MYSRLIILVLLVLQVRNSVPDDTCDQTRTWATEGNQGQAGTFPWLGVIRVQLHEGTKLRIAVTGSVLVKATHALAIADDIVKIPKKIFQQDSKAMFIPYGNQTWLSRLKDYLLHPEYAYATHNTIALIELDPGEGNKITIQPLCWPSYLYNTSNPLYALGYTDENELLEKVVHKLQYIDKTLCEAYYNRAGSTGQTNTPSRYLCGLAGNNTKDCDWDNGMVLASNSSGPWVLIGFGIRGPGCSAPSRFIEMFQYLPWIETSTSNVEYTDNSDSNRKSAFGTGFEQLREQNKSRIKDIPIHQLFRSGDIIYGDTKPWLRAAPQGETKLTSRWFDSKYGYLLWQIYDIERIDKDAIVLSSFGNKFEKGAGDCLKRFKYLCYTETIKIYAYPQQRGFVTYKLALMDLLARDYNCITIRIDSESRSATHLWYKTTMDVDEPIDGYDRTPDYLLKKYPLPKHGKGNDKFPFDTLEPRFETDSTRSWANRRNVNLFVQFRFLDEAYLKLQIWGPLATIPMPPASPFGRRLGYTYNASTVVHWTPPTPRSETPFYLKPNRKIDVIYWRFRNQAAQKIGKVIGKSNVENETDRSVEVARVVEVSRTPSRGGRVRVDALAIAVAVYLAV